MLLLESSALLVLLHEKLSLNRYEHKNPSEKFERHNRDDLDPRAYGKSSRLIAIYSLLQPFNTRVYQDRKRFSSDL